MEIKFFRKYLEVPLECEIESQEHDIEFFECDIMSESENRILTSYNLKTSQMTVIDNFKNQIESAEKCQIDIDGVVKEYNVLTSYVEQHENYAILRINLN